MAAPTSVSDIIAASAAGKSQTVRFEINQDAVTINAGSWYHARANLDGNMGRFVSPTTVAVPVANSLGSVRYKEAASGTRLYVLSAAMGQPDPFVDPSPGAIYFYDRLLHIGGLDGTLTSAQTVGGTLTRNTGGVGNRIYYEIYSALGTTETTITASYTNQDGTSGRTTRPAHVGGTAEFAPNDFYQAWELMLQAGDTGVQSVEDVTLAASTGTAGLFGIAVVRPICQFPVDGSGGIFDGTLGLKEIPWLEPGTCLSYYMAAMNNEERAIAGHLRLVES